MLAPLRRSLVPVMARGLSSQEKTLLFFQGQGGPSPRAEGSMSGAVPDPFFSRKGTLFRVRWCRRDRSRSRADWARWSKWKGSRAWARPQPKLPALSSPSGAFPLPWGFPPWSVHFHGFLKDAKGTGKILPPPLHWFGWIARWRGGERDQAL